MNLLNVGVIGMGNCGGQMADLAAGAGFDAIAINASSDDMSTLINKVECFLVGDGNGTGKSRLTAKEFLKDHNNIFKDQRMVEFIMRHDAIVITTSIGGGFGSGTSLEFTATLTADYPDKLFIPTGVLPFNSELYTAQNHSIGWVQELEELNIPYILYDNDRYKGEKEKTACELVNMNFVKDLEIMRGDFIYETRTGGIDPRDLLTVLSTPGRIVMGSMTGIDVDDLVDKSLIRTLAEYISNDSAHAELTDDKQILASATMYYLPDEFDLYKGSVRSDLQQMYGGHVSDYTNFADMFEDSQDPEPCIAVILAGLSSPQTRIARLVKRRERLAAEITSRKPAESKVHGIDTNSMDSKLTLGAKSFGRTDSKSMYRKPTPSESNNKENK